MSDPLLDAYYMVLSKLRILCFICTISRMSKKELGVSYWINSNIQFKNICTVHASVRESNLSAISI